MEALQMLDITKVQCEDLINFTGDKFWFQHNLFL